MKTHSPTERRPSVRHTRVARLAGALVLTLSLVLGVGITRTERAGAATPPELVARVTQRCDKVLLSWHFDDQGRQRDRSLEIQRATTGDFSTVLTHAKPSRRGRTADPVCPTVTTRYRARLVISTEDAASQVRVTTTPWGPVVTVQPGDPTTTVAPTTTTTVAPGTTTPTTVKPPPGVTMCPESYDDKVIADVNAFRKQNGLFPLRSNAQLNNAANRRAADLAAIGQLDGHAGYLEAVQDAGYAYWWVGEWLHWYISVDRVVGGWIASPPHRDAMLWAHFPEVGIGCATGPWGGPFWSMIGGTPGR